MLKTRVISALVGLALLVAALYMGSLFLGIIVCVIAAIGLHEFYNSLEKANFKPIKLVGYLSIIPLLLLVFNYAKIIDLDMAKVTAVSAFILIVLCMTVIVFANNKYNIIDACITIFGVAYIPFTLSFVITIRNLDFGIILIWLIFIGAWGTDTMAYTCGRLFGKRKILPEISPKKTLGGAVGGAIGCLLLMMAFGYIVEVYFGLKMSYVALAIVGLFCGVVSQVGDWCASAIKRYVNIKDFGNIMPGHGGVIDRFDSILFVAPTVYFLLTSFI